jgi:nucleoside-diphosphate-sugar epimerase
MKILLTGATGFVPSNLVLHFYEAGDTVVAFDRNEPEARLIRELGTGSEARVTFVQGDIRDSATIERIFAEHQPTQVVHAAAITPTLEMERADPRQILDVNSASTISLLQAAAKHGVERFIYFSSVSVYERRDATSYVVDEDGPLHRGDRMYPLSKITGERLCHWAQAHYGLDVRIVRPGTVYGPYERPTGARQSMSSACLAADLALRGETLKPNAPHVTQSWIHAADVAKGVRLLLTTPELPHDTFNLAGEPVPQARLIAAVAAAIPGTNVEWVASEAEANIPLSADSGRLTFDNRRLWRATGFEPTYRIETGIEQYVGWLRAADTADRS